MRMKNYDNIYMITDDRKVTYKSSYLLYISYSMWYILGTQKASNSTYKLG